MAPQDTHCSGPRGQLLELQGSTLIASTTSSARAAAQWKAQQELSGTVRFHLSRALPRESSTAQCSVRRAAGCIKPSLSELWLALCLEDARELLEPAEPREVTELAEDGTRRWARWRRGGGGTSRLAPPPQ
eukprot:SRR837773.25115.p3 GENE.SRR837773.25115~~SRR837773.25115.p3  ORF type:complete len:142 (+),score=18.24 SRR837773.25115:35-427(+)